MIYIFEPIRILPIFASNRDIKVLDVKSEKDIF